MAGNTIMTIPTNRTPEEDIHKLHLILLDYRQAVEEKKPAQAFVEAKEALDAYYGERGNPDKPPEAQSEASTADTLREINQVYEFKPGSFYVIEYDVRKVSRSTAYALRDALLEAKIYNYMVASEGGDALRPVPAIERQLKSAISTKRSK